MKLPEAFEKRMKEMLGSDYDAFLRSYDRPNTPSLRLNPLKGDVTATRAELKRDRISDLFREIISFFSPERGGRSHKGKCPVSAPVNRLCPCAALR